MEKAIEKKIEEKIGAIKESGLPDRPRSRQEKRNKGGSKKTRKKKRYNNKID